ncbi:MAG: glycosyltransferase [Thermodesulfovibrionales bacterium]
MRRLKVLHVIATLPVGGVEHQLLTLLKHYDRQRIEPLVCTLAEPGQLAGEIESGGVRVVPLGGLGHSFSPGLVRSLAALMRQERADVVRTHQYHANLYGRIAARLAGAPCVVASVHNLYTRDRKLHRRLFNNILSRVSDRIIAVSGAVKDDILRYDRISGDRVEVIYNGIEPERLRSGDGGRVRAEFGIPGGDPVVGTVGRLTVQKGHRYLLEAMAQVTRQHPRARLCIVGDGPERAGLAAEAGRLGIADRVVFTGSRRDIPDLLAMFDVFAFPSLWEGLPNALIEAMAAGRAVVGASIPPVREVLREGETGVLVPEKDAAALAEAVSGLLADPGRARGYGAAAQKDAAERFSITSTVRRYEALFEEILGRKERGS